MKEKKKVEVEVGGVNFFVEVDYSCGHPGTREDPPDDAEIEIKTIRIVGLEGAPDLKDTFEEMGDLAVLEEKVWEELDNGREIED